MILGESLHRASIDIDIICPPGTNIEEYLVEMERHGFVCTGAGISRESGLPIFRGEGGLWDRLDINAVADRKPKDAAMFMNIFLLPLLKVLCN